ncbi:hypothetical protein [Staphylococcus aureus]|uniref:hypothetical protein n=1 Tax=Staphylococcus aureus TaxID=1280 RepID=UPI0035CF5551
MFILKKKDDNTYECSFYNPESTNSASDIESKISMTGYSITNKIHRLLMNPAYALN